MKLMKKSQEKGPYCEKIDEVSMEDSSHSKKKIRAANNMNSDKLLTEISMFDLH
jgi:hypothetical protein